MGNPVDLKIHVCYCFQMNEKTKHCAMAWMKLEIVVIIIIHRKSTAEPFSKTSKMTNC